MSSLAIIISVLGGLGIGYGLFKGFSGSGSKVLSKLHEAFQKKKVEEVKEIEKKQNVVKTVITTKENIAKDSQKKIKDIQKKAADEIEEVLKEEDVSNIHKSITNDWEEI